MPAMATAGPAATATPNLLCFVAKAMPLPMNVATIMTRAAEMMVWFTENTHMKNSNPELAAHRTNAARM